MLNEFPGTTCPVHGIPKVIHHTTRHHLVATPGPPVAQNLRRPALDKFWAAKKKFDALFKLGNDRPSQSFWAAPLHLFPKKGDEWRPCGDIVGSMPEQFQTVTQFDPEIENPCKLLLMFFN
ncbi:hypothetical protein JTB14_032228 [Gonioctena quinquepunctata]|nr:hypothetical protein JTB14_032228 [Gonioctena quinquepunctata]